jgi:integrase
LVKHRQEQDRLRELAGPRWVERGVVFTSRHGRPLDSTDVRRDFRTEIRRAPRIDLKTWTTREPRHSFVSLLSDSGGPIEEISRLVGHKSAGPVVHRDGAHEVQSIRDERRPSQ